MNKHCYVYHLAFFNWHFPKSLNILNRHELGEQLQLDCYRHRMASITRKAAPRPTKPAQRHFAKKGPTAARDEDGSSDEQEHAVVEQASDEEIGTFGQEVDVQSFISPDKLPGKGTRVVKVALGNVNVKDGRVLVDVQADAGKMIGEEGQCLHFHVFGID
jgi:hypothetical protein